MLKCKFVVEHQQVIRNHLGEVELELNPLSIKLLKHQSVPRPAHVPTVVGGYSAAALHATGASYNVPNNNNNTITRRYHAYQVNLHNCCRCCKTIYDLSPNQIMVIHWRLCI